MCRDPRHVVIQDEQLVYVFNYFHFGVIISFHTDNGVLVFIFMFVHVCTYKTFLVYAWQSLIVYVRIMLYVYGSSL